MQDEDVCAQRAESRQRERCVRGCWTMAGAAAASPRARSRSSIHSVLFSSSCDCGIAMSGLPQRGRLHFETWRWPQLQLLALVGCCALRVRGSSLAAFSAPCRPLRVALPCVLSVLARCADERFIPALLRCLAALGRPDDLSALQKAQNSGAHRTGHLCTAALFGTPPPPP